jgi:D-glycero-alpha-D-manno-heptose-7-phosphate kinase
MIITKSPLRLSIAGGGTDLPSYYKIKEALFISAAINKHIFISVNKTWKPYYFLKYSKIENKKKISKIQHPVIKSALSKYKIDEFVEISSISDVPAGTGLGSSGTFAVGLVNALNIFNNKNLSPKQIAEEACDIEMNILNEPCGKQDQYIASYGGLRIFEINKEGKVFIKDLELKEDFVDCFEENLLIFFTGYSRKSKHILNEQEIAVKKKEKEIIKNLDFIKNIAKETITALKNSSLKEYADLMNEHWKFKLLRSKDMSSNFINEIISIGLKNGAIGSKVIGAGGGGFVMFICQDKEKLRSKMKELKLRELKFDFDYDGTTILSRR